MRHANTAATLAWLGGSMLLAAPAEASLIEFDFENVDATQHSFAPSKISSDAQEAGLEVTAIQGTHDLYSASSYYTHPETHHAALLYSAESGDAYTFTITPPRTMRLKLTSYRLSLGATKDAISALKLDIAGETGAVLTASGGNYNTNEGELDATLPAGEPATINLTVVSDELNNYYLGNLELDGKLEAVTAPEPMSLLLLGAGVVAVTMQRRRG